MYSLEISAKNTDETTGSAFQEVAQQFVEELQRVSDLEINTQTQHVEHTRGVWILLSGIIASGVQIGAFAAIYLLAKDLYARYVNAEVVLTFKDGSTLTLKNLTQKEAEKRIKAHLESGLAKEG